MNESQNTALVKLSADNATIVAKGSWILSNVGALQGEIRSIFKQSESSVAIDASQISALDSAGALLLHHILLQGQQTQKTIRLIGLERKHQTIFDLVSRQIKPVRELPPPAKREPLLQEVGRWAVKKYLAALQFLAFVGEVTLLILRRKFLPSSQLWQATLKIVQEVGCQALGIVALMIFLIGIVVAYQLGVQLQMYSADIYIVDATGIGMLREFAPLMTAIIVAARTSTSFAALIGTMKINEELDALTTMGISPLDRLVLPRLAGVLIALPLLVVWAVCFGLFGSVLMAKWLLNIDYNVFFARFVVAVALKQYILGMIKTPFFALIIAGTGCFQGFQVGNTADSVGLKTTQAAVQAIFLLIIADGAFSILYSWRGL